MNIKEEEEIKKEFQLERVVLFSDAVFAIIITIMVLEIKLPEGMRHAPVEKVHHALLELLPKLVGYILSFFIVGVFWAKHLKLFSYLKDYTKELIAFNLVFLFFISLFPLTVSILTETLTPHNFDGLFIYFTVVLLALLTQTLLTGYLVHNANELCIKPEEVEARLEWKAQRINYFSIPVIIIYIVAGKLLNFPPQAYSYGFLIWAMSIALIRRKFYPAQFNSEGPFLKRLFSSRKIKRTNGNN